MISYRLSDEHEDLRLIVAEFARDVVAPVIGGFYERREFPYEIVARMGKLGLFGLPFPEEYGGMGGDFFALCVALHELGQGRLVGRHHPRGGGGTRRDADLPVRQPGAARALASRSLPGERLAAFGLTEPGGGSDIPGGMRTTARLVKGDSGRGWGAGNG